MDRWVLSEVCAEPTGIELPCPKSQRETVSMTPRIYSDFF
jgi:hypothetical protein